jgi:hypothetical protein
MKTPVIQNSVNDCGSNTYLSDFLGIKRPYHSSFCLVSTQQMTAVPKAMNCTLAHLIYKMHFIDQTIYL